MAALAKHRKAVQERGTAVVKNQLAERGFCGMFKASVLLELDWLWLFCFQHLNKLFLHYTFMFFTDQFAPCRS